MRQLITRKPTKSEFHIINGLMTGVLTELRAIETSPTWARFEAVLNLTETLMNDWADIKQGGVGILDWAERNHWKAMRLLHERVWETA